MMMRVLSKTVLVCILSSLTYVSPVFAEDGDDYANQAAEPITLLINFQIAGQTDSTSFTDLGVQYYTVGGPGYVPERIYRNGVVSDDLDSERQIVNLEGAQITFSGEPTDPIVNFTCLPGSCKMRFKDGSVLESNAGVQLEGRAINMWGPVYKSPKFDPVNGIIPIRILGCGGLKEVAGKGRLAGMVGSVCFNGVLNFNKINPMVLTGSSKCTITMHTPMDPESIP